MLFTKMHRKSQYSQYIPLAKVPEMVQQTAITTLTNDKSTIITKHAYYIYTQTKINTVLGNYISTHAEIIFNTYICITFLS